MDPSRFWLRRDDNDRARQVVYDEVQLNRYSDRQRRAILKVMARTKTASHRDISQAALRARTRSRGELLVTIALVLAALAVLVIVFAERHRGSNQAVATEAAASGRTAVAGAAQAPPEDLTTVMENADRAWLTDVGAGKVASANDGSDALSLPESAPLDAAPEQPTPRHSRASRKAHDRSR